MNFVVARKIMPSTGYMRYSPTAKITRAEFLMMIMKAYNIAPDLNPVDNFDDADQTEYSGYLAAAKRLKLSNGVGDNKFAPNAVITRQETFTFLYNILTLTNKLGEGEIEKKVSDFNDGNVVADWAREPMQKLISAGIIQGSDNYIIPYSNTTRAEFAQIIYNLLKK
ncbi:MAG: S-layer homology domain-containing protein [Clostridiales bacterium]|nr:S-layer homology domain-containing protein [Clostridiales bacterium]